MGVIVRIYGSIYRLSEEEVNSLQSLLSQLETRFGEIRDQYQKDISKITSDEFFKPEQSDVARRLHKLYDNEQYLVNQYEDLIDRIRTYEDDHGSNGIAFIEFDDAYRIYAKILGFIKDDGFSLEERSRMREILNSYLPKDEGESSD